MNAPIMVDAGHETDPLEVSLMQTRHILHCSSSQQGYACALAARCWVCLQNSTGFWLWLQIATKELREKKIPFTIRRYLPDGRCAMGSIVWHCGDNNRQVCHMPLKDATHNFMYLIYQHKTPAAVYILCISYCRSRLCPLKPVCVGCSYEDWPVSSLMLTDK